MISSLPIGLIKTKQEQNLIKLLCFPLAFRCLFDKLFEKKWLPYMGKHGGIIGYMLTASIIGVTFSFEKMSMAPSMDRMVRNYSHQAKPEDRAWFATMARTRTLIAERYYQ